MVLYVDACVRKESRTKRIANHLIDKLGEPFELLRLETCDFPVVDADFITKRDDLLRQQAYEDPMFDYARQFASADEIVIAAPFWDLSFPARLKQYLEQVCVVGVTFRYTQEGRPEGMCKAKKLYYVTTSGGDYFPEQYGFGYVQALARNFYGISDVQLIKATGLDVIGAPVEQILLATEREIDKCP